MDGIGEILGSSDKPRKHRRGQVQVFGGLRARRGPEKSLAALAEAAFSF
jgi:hypothetical protein